MVMEMVKRKRMEEKSIWYALRQARNETSVFVCGREVKSREVFIG